MKIRSFIFFETPMVIFYYFPEKNQVHKKEMRSVLIFNSQSQRLDMIQRVISGIVVIVVAW